MSAFIVLLRMELRRLFRTEEVFLYALLPALLGLPALGFTGVLAASFLGQEGVVALPPDLPAELDLPDRLAERDFQVIVRADPRGAWERGEVDVAVVAWRLGPGIGASRREEERARWELDLVADDADAAREVERAAEDAGSDVLADLVALAGGDPAEVLDFADVQTVTAGDALDLPFAPRPAAVAYGLFMLGLVGFFFLTLPAVADRREGVTEALRVLPVPPTAMLWARLGALLVVQGLVGALLVVNLVLLFAPFARGEMVDVPGLADLPGAIAGVVLVDALYVAVGVLSPTARTANNTSSITMTIQLVALGAGLFASPPAWVPMAGLLVAQGLSERVVAVIATLLPAVLIVELCGRLQASRVDLVLPKGAE